MHIYKQLLGLDQLEEGPFLVSQMLVTASLPMLNWALGAWAFAFPEQNALQSADMVPSGVEVRLAA